MAGRPTRRAGVTAPRRIEDAFWWTVPFSCTGSASEYKSVLDCRMMQIHG